MYNVSEDFINAMKAPVKELQGFVKGDYDTITSEDDLIEFSLTVESGLISTTMKRVEIKAYNNHYLSRESVDVGFGVRLADDSYEFLTLGNFIIVEQNTLIDEGTTTYIGYDKMLLFMEKYEPLEVEYPISVYDYAEAICNKIGIELKNEEFEFNSDFLINEELWLNIDGITYRDILQQIAEVTCTTAIITQDNKLSFKYFWDEYDELTYSELISIKDNYDNPAFNSVVLARTPQEDNIYMRDDEIIALVGLNEYKIENNQIADKDRETAIVDIFEAMTQIGYQECECKTIGLGYYEIGDRLWLGGYEDPTSSILPIHYIKLQFDGGIQETFKSFALNKPQTQYQYATSINKRIKNTEIVVNKQEQYINQLVSDMYEENGVVNEKYTQIHQDINNIVNTVQASGGINLIKNSVMYASDSSNNPTEWTVTGNGKLNIHTSSESLMYGCISGNVFVLNNKTVKQRIKVKPSDENNKYYYSFSCKIKKDLSGTCYIKLYNDTDEFIINVSAGESPFYVEYQLNSITTTDNYLDVEFYGSTDSNATFTDNILCLGENALNWQQADGELMNTQVNINKDGVLVKSSVYMGDYTVMSPLEFAGYSNINGVTTKIFSLNKDTTISKKLRCEDEITMTPLKIVPVLNGDLQGWAFVPITNEEVE